ncbi:TIGR02217 family protein [Caulobacter vibrioides]|uniref:TIGR02217 family protein n=1 Tax=Caulobacter vibrioides TaxID=155892 RepID=A0A290MRZ1_CAUVI|nr:TIGR02217 family protein [Caulobacter vibrioides]ATC31105.1 TIGR02217 family protein [Caulobacter vibrioides]
MMSEFHEARLPARLAFGCTGGVERRTDVVSLASGHERRTSPWAQSRRRYLIATAPRPLDEIAELVAFFEARRGRLHGFRFRDPADCKSCAPSVQPAAGDQAIGTGDGARKAFQLRKTYGAGGEAVVRTIAKPVAGTVTVAVAGVALAPGAFAVDVTTGLVTLNTAPAAGAAVTAGFAFDTPVRFDLDRLDVTLEGFAAARVTACSLVEVLV